MYKDMKHSFTIQSVEFVPARMDRCDQGLCAQNISFFILFSQLNLNQFVTLVPSPQVAPYDVHLNAITHVLWDIKLLVECHGVVLFKDYRY
jgi:hypothetical protein